MLLCILLTACQKKPTASFIFNKAEYIAGDTIRLTNMSTNGQSYVWTLPDGTTNTGINLDYIIDRNLGFATLAFTLEAYSKKEKKNNTVTQSVSVIPASWYGFNYPSYYPRNISSAPNGNNWLIHTSYIYNDYGNSCVSCGQHVLNYLYPFIYLAHRLL